MKNLYGETVKPQYEVALKRVASWRDDQEQALIDEDYETFGYIPASNYRETVREAKAASMSLGKEVSGDNGKGILREVCIVCYFEDDISSYNQAWIEVYAYGKKEGRYQW